MPKTILVTGAAGFIGPQVVRLLFEETDYNVVVLDKLTYAARVEDNKPLSIGMVLGSLKNKENIKDRYTFINLDICSDEIPRIIKNLKIDYIMNLAAESHVDRSIDGSPEFLLTEIFGTHNLLETIRKNNSESGHKIERALFVSTDEVFGSIDRISRYEGEHWYSLSDSEVSELIDKYKFTEETPFAGGSPYASCKGGADLLVGSYYNTFKWNNTTGNVDVTRMPIMVTHCVNNFGPFQHPEKLIPIAICTLLMPEVDNFKRKIPVYDNGLAVREWIHSIDHAEAIIKVMNNGSIGESYNIGSGVRCRNLQILHTIFEACKKEATENGFHSLAHASFDASKLGGMVRPGHDLCYAADSSKIRKDSQIDWDPKADWRVIEKEIIDTVEWYKQNRHWWVPVWTSKDFSDYWNRKYKDVQKTNIEPFDFYTKASSV